MRHVCPRKISITASARAFCPDPGSWGKTSPAAMKAAWGEFALSMNFKTKAFFGRIIVDMDRIGSGPRQGFDPEALNAAAVYKEYQCGTSFS